MNPYIETIYILRGIDQWFQKHVSDEEKDNFGIKFSGLSLLITRIGHFWLPKCMILETIIEELYTKIPVSQAILAIEHLCDQHDFITEYEKERLQKLKKICVEQMNHEKYFYITIQEPAQLEITIDKCAFTKK